MNDANRSASSGEAALPLSAAEKIAPAFFSVQSSDGIWFMPWSESRLPLAWKKSCCCFNALRNPLNVVALVPEASLKAFTHFLKRSGWLTRSALSGRNAGNTFTFQPDFLMAL